jgi:preprotein translocase subunit SecB
MTHQADSTYEVVLSAHAEAVVAGKTVFILEVQYGALVELNEQLIGQEHIHPVLLIEIPRQMFPFVRQIVADLTVSGGFPPLFLQLIDFAELYRAKYGVPGRPVNGDGEAPTIN